MGSETEVEPTPWASSIGDRFSQLLFYPTVLDRSTVARGGVNKKASGTVLDGRLFVRLRVFFMITLVVQIRSDCPISIPLMTGNVSHRAGLRSVAPTSFRGGLVLA